jgi:hypothetical protein
MTWLVVFVDRVMVAFEVDSEIEVVPATPPCCV